MCALFGGLEKMVINENIMLRCLQLAQLAQYDVAPNPMVGAVLVDEKTHRIAAEGWHQYFGGPHAEVNCFLDAQAKGITDFSGYTLYVSLEPCSHYGKTPPCADLIIKKGVRRVVVGLLDPNPQVAGNGIRKLKEAGIEVVVGVKEKECRHLNRRFLCLHEKNRPYIILKWAQSEDGFIDIVRTKEQALTTPPARLSDDVTKQLVHQMRAENMAIMVGTRTVLLDNPRLLTTHWSGPNPIRITIDRNHILPPDRRIFSPDAETIVYTDLPNDNTDALKTIIADLAKRHIHSLLVEGGTTLLNTFLRNNLYDEVHIEIAPVRLHQGIQAPLFPIADMQMLLNTNGHILYEYTQHSE
ncbi:MAG: bifunctional diaminohydroxyphosphoribosylaminopyrimidine deaminase/5-amino-6-(5-phosphoribosylamino)uracil reductase RibD [Paludibacteraceae bacterium]|nr:bifunctional diaminohydroxyphosphoribosylaminopyrimidine deaminase/5-amino-6-(5-phosphoribosylamino)uracil reductase RibD [Paludibacteraceae bacterium]